MPAAATDGGLEPGVPVMVRGRRWVVCDVEPSRGSTLVTLQGADGDVLSVIWEVEPGCRVLSGEPPSEPVPCPESS